MKKRKLEVVVLSDIHLGNAQCRAEELLIYLSSIKPRVLVLNGGITSTFHEKSSFPKSHIKVVKKILSMMSDGTRVYYITGNGDRPWEKLSGFETSNMSIKKNLALNLDGKTTFFLYGDILDTFPGMARWLGNLGTLGYKMLGLNRKICRGLKVHLKSKTSFDETGTDDGGSHNLSVLSKFDKIAASTAVQSGYDTMVCGFTDQPRKAIWETPKGSCLYLNAGSWTRNLTALEYSFKRWKVYNFKLDKLTAFYGDEELSEIDIPQLLRHLKEEDSWESKPRTAS